jgi:cytoskeletal protein CcmA (bactofilin family)
MDNSLNSTDGSPQDLEGATLSSINDTDTSSAHVPAASLFDFSPAGETVEPAPVAAAPAVAAEAPKPVGASPVVGFDLNAAPDPSTRVDLSSEASSRIDAEAAFEKAIAADAAAKAPIVESIPVADFEVTSTLDAVVPDYEAAPILDPGSTSEFPAIGLVNADIEAQANAAVEEINAARLAVASAELPTVEEPVASYAAEDAVADEEPLEKGISVITREATVLGDIITEGHIDVVGRVKGNIDAKGDIAIHGIVRGDVGGEKIGLYNCRVKGNLESWLGVIVDEGSIIGGDVKTKNIILDGKVKGNIDAENVVVLRSHSYCLGDVSAASLAVEPGAILNGKVRTFVKGDLEAPFDEVM